MVPRGPGASSATSGWSEELADHAVEIFELDDQGAYDAFLVATKADPAVGSLADQDREGSPRSPRSPAHEVRGYE